MIKYGKETRTEWVDENIQRQTRQTYVNWQAVQEHVAIIERVKVKDHKDVLAEFIKLQNRQKAGEVYNIGINTIEKPKGTLVFVELIYEVEHNKA